MSVRGCLVPEQCGHAAQRQASLRWPQQFREDGRCGRRSVLVPTRLAAWMAGLEGPGGGRRAMYVCRSVGKCSSMWVGDHRDPVLQHCTARCSRLDASLPCRPRHRPDPMATLKNASHGSSLENMPKPERTRLSPAARRVRRKNIDNCLLYTSPSPRDGLLSRMPSSA